MPADRTKALTYVDAGAEGMWAPFVDQEAMSTSPLSFIANVTPVDFSSDSPPPLVDPPSEFILFPPAEEAIAPRRQPHSKKKPENHIPRPPNAFILFRSSFIKSQHVSTEVETNHSTLSKIIGITWQSLPDQERQIWHQKAKEALEEHKRRFPKYAFRPVQTKAKGAASEKRKVREVEPKDIKRCKKIAQLLVSGKKGQELENAIQEFDKHHVPEVVTRFETPITARTYRRSSSAPIPDTENTRAQKTFLQTVSDAQKHKPRAASTRCSTPSDYSDTQSSVESAVDAQVLAPKEESFAFDAFSFDNAAAPMPSYDCDPLAGMQRAASFDEGPYHPTLTIDTNFMANDWVPSPSPMSPSTPDYFMHPDSAIDVSPIPPFASSFNQFDHMPLEKPFEDFSATFPTVLDQPCAMNQPHIVTCETVDTNVLYPYNQQQQSIDLGDIDLDFSTFMNSIQAM